jgi:uncharacterized iron-regulated protein
MSYTAKSGQPKRDLPYGLAASPAARPAAIVTAACLLYALACSAVAGAPSVQPVQLIHADHPLVDRIWSVRERRYVDEPAVVAALRGARFVLLGERHGNPEHHRLQGRLIRELAAGNAPLAVVAEQLDFPQQAAIDACAADCADFGADLGGRVAWSASGWPDYALYAPVFEAAAAARATVHAGNPGGKRIRALSRGEAPAADEAAWAARAGDQLRPEAHERLLRHLSEGHCGHLPEERAAPVVRAQRLRDAALATTLTRASGAGAAAGTSADRGTGVLIAGAGHARRDYGVPTLLDPGERTVVIAFMEVAPNSELPELYAPADAYDYLWFTARVDEPDPCVQFREQLQKMKPAAPR